MPARERRRLGLLAVGMAAAVALMVIPGVWPEAPRIPAVAEPVPAPAPAGSPAAGPGEPALDDVLRPPEDPPAAPPRRTVYLTFDDGPSEITLQVLDILGQYQVPATFFVCGNHWEFGRNAYRRMVDEGHAIGNHSYTHNYSRIYASAEAFWSDFDRLQDLLEEVTGERPRIMRFPGGSNTGYASRQLMDELMAGVRERGYHYFDWNVCSGDWVPGQDAEVIIRRVLDRVPLQEQTIVLFHDSEIRITTPQALPVILEALIAGGVRFRTLSPTSFRVQFPR